MQINHDIDRRVPHVDIAPVRIGHTRPMPRLVQIPESPEPEERKLNVLQAAMVAVLFTAALALLTWMVIRAPSPREVEGRRDGSNAGANAVTLQDLQDESEVGDG